MLIIRGEKSCQNHTALLVISGIQVVTTSGKLITPGIDFLRCRVYGTKYVYNNPQLQAINNRCRLLIRYALYL